MQVVVALIQAWNNSAICLTIENRATLDRQIGSRLVKIHGGFDALFQLMRSENIRI